MHRIVVALGLLSALSLAQYPGAEPVPALLAPGFNTITEGYCREILTYLAGDECAGRGTGSPGYDKAAEFVAKQFKEMGLLPAGDDGTYFQQVPFKRYRIDAKTSGMVVKDQRFKIGEDLELQASAGDFEGELLFISGTGPLEDPTVLRNKIVVLSSEPVNFREGLGAQSLRDRPRAILRVVDAVSEAAWESRRGGRGPSRNRVNGSITSTAARRLARAVGLVDSVVDVTETVIVRAPKEPVEGTITVQIEEAEKGVPNLVALLPGSDPKLKDQMVICGSHLDHLGERNGVIYHGADDDGSGSTGLIALARALTSNPVKPKRSVLFLAFCGEELGLVGSAYYTDHPRFPLEKAVCELQMDMIGRNEEKRGEKPEDNLNTTHLVGSKRISMDLHEYVLEANRHIGFVFEDDEEGVYTRSDHYNFAKHGIPISFFFSGFHPDYHKPTDTVDKINFQKLANTAKLVYLIVHSVGNAAEAPKKNAK